MDYLAKNLNFLLNRNKIEVNDLATSLGISSERIKNSLTDNRTVEVEVLQSLSKYFALSIDDLVNKDLDVLNGIDTSSIKLLILDVDGVMTDGGMYYTEHGDELKKFNAKDGMAIKRIAAEGIIVGIISSGTNKRIIESRAKKLNIKKVHAGEEPKEKVLAKWLKELNISSAQTAFIGDDVNDLNIMKTVGVAVCPTDAVPEVRNVCQVILEKKGGDGCVREFIDSFLLHPLVPNS